MPIAAPTHAKCCAFTVADRPNSKAHPPLHRLRLNFPSFHQYSEELAIGKTRSCTPCLTGPPDRGKRARKSLCFACCQPTVRVTCLLNGQQRQQQAFPVCRLPEKGLTEAAHLSGSAGGDCWDSRSIAAPSSSHGRRRGHRAQQQRQAAAAAAAPPARVSGLVITAWIALWISISVSIIIVNKHVLYYTKFHFPFLLALCHMITGSLFARAAIWGLSIRDTVAEQNSFQLNSRLALVGVLFAVVLATGNAALLHLTVPTAQMLKAAGPATIYLVSIMLGTDVPRVVQAVQVLVVCTGVGIASHGDLTLTAAGLLLQLTSIFADSLRCCFLQKVMQSNHLQANALVTLAHVAPYSAFAMVVPVVLGEALTVVDTYSEWRSAIPLVCLSSMLAAVLNVVVFKVIGLTSALTTSLSGVLKEWATILVAMGIYGTPVSSMQWVGYSIALSGLTWYNVSRIARSRQQAEEAGKGGEVALQGAVAEKAALLGDASSSKAARDEEMGE